MTTIRGPRKDRHFAILDNGLLRNPQLSLAARGLLGYILSFPPDHEVSAQALLDEPGMPGRDALRALFRELENTGYVVRERSQKDDGRLTWTTTVYEEPQTPVRGSTSDGKPATGLTRENGAKPQVPPVTGNPSLAPSLEGLEVLPLGGDGWPGPPSPPPESLKHELVRTWVNGCRAEGHEPTEARKAKLAGNLTRLIDKEGRTDRRALLITVKAMAAEGKPIGYIDDVLADVERELHQREERSNGTRRGSR